MVITTHCVYISVVTIYLLQSLRARNYHVASGHHAAVERGCPQGWTYAETGNSFTCRMQPQPACFPPPLSLSPSTAQSMSQGSRKKLEDSIHLSAAPKRGRPTKPKRVTLIFFITGNPGLIEYYRTFFHCLRDNLRQDADEQNHVFEICGSSLVGFELSEHDHVARIAQGLEHTPPYSLSEVVDAVETSLSGMTSIIEQLKPGKEVDVILMGHSVGAYIALEVLQRHRRRLGAGARESRISGVVCLFPTVVDIGKSERGRVLSVRAPSMFSNKLSRRNLMQVTRRRSHASPTSPSSSPSSQSCSHSSSTPSSSTPSRQP